MSNTLKLTEAIKYKGYQVGCIDSDVSILSEDDLSNVTDNLGESTDIFITKKDNESEVWVVELTTVDDEIDIRVTDGYTYFKKYGLIENAYTFGEITQQQYNYYISMEV